jgi:hypothetical protein
MHRRLVPTALQGVTVCDLGSVSQAVRVLRWKNSINRRKERFGHGDRVSIIVMSYTPQHNATPRIWSSEIVDSTPSALPGRDWQQPGARPSLQVNRLGRHGGRSPGPRQAANARIRDHFVALRRPPLATTSLTTSRSACCCAVTVLVTVQHTHWGVKDQFRAVRNPSPSAMLGDTATNRRDSLRLRLVSSVSTNNRTERRLHVPSPALRRTSG